MRYLLTSLLCVFTLSLTAQEAGCTYQQADNYSSTATIDNGSCIFFTITQDDCNNTYDGNDDGNVSISDFLELLSLFGDTDVDADGVWDSLDDCLDLAACNYFADPSAICQYLDIIGVCGGDCWLDDDSDLICDDIDDCVGYYDECEVCNGSGIPEGYCDCFGSVLDECGTCDDDPTNDCVQDCNGEWGGTAVLDECDTCDSDPTNDCVQDCNQEWGGTAELDECGTCDSDLSNDCVQDCNGDWGGVAALDECGVCDEDVTNDCVQDCNEEWGGTALLDECGVCDSDPTNDCVQDCNGVWGGTAVLDECGVCDGPGPTEIVIESITILYDSLYAEQIDEWWVYEVGADTVFNYTCAPTCGDAITHEGYDYSTVLIGDQCWFSENCRYLPEVSPSSDGSETEPYYYVYDYQGTDVEAAIATPNYETYGVLYNWPAVMTEGICPSGWHIPSDEEWQTMEISLGMSEAEAASEGFRGSPVGDYMKSTSGWNGGNGSNSSGFTGLPGGYRYSGSFNLNGYNGDWWSVSDYGISSWSWRRSLRNDSDNVIRYYEHRDHGFSARCVRCEADEDGDGICDNTDECVDNTACNFEAVPSEPCEYTSCAGCMDSSFCNYDSTATIDDGSCEGVGVLDECGVCNGPGPTELVIDTITLLYDSIYSEAISEWWVFETGADTTYTYECLTLITQANIHEAVDLWLSDELTAEATYGHISDWDVSNVTDMSSLFKDTYTFNGDLSSWDVSSVTDMSYMFKHDIPIVSECGCASSFNSDLSAWDVSSVTDMKYMFTAASNFNSDISGWDVSSVTNMKYMFEDAPNFNSDISGWDVSSVTDMKYMFSTGQCDCASSFNGDISAWDVSSVTNMSGMFYSHEFSNDVFNSDLSSWDVSSVTDMSGMFDGTSALSEENQCLIHTSFSSNANWPYDWSEFCPTVCGDLVSHDGYNYSTVLIGDQCWFAENCRYLPVVSPSSAGSETSPYYYVYGYEGSTVSEAQATSNYDTYGVLYNWPAVMTEGICPSGWHIPSDGEFTQLTDFLGGSSVAGYAMKSTDGWNYDGNGSNSSGWTGLPGGYRYDYGFIFNGSFGLWWSASVTDSNESSWLRELGSSIDYVHRGGHNQSKGLSARCVRD